MHRDLWVFTAVCGLWGWCMTVTEWLSGVCTRDWLHLWAPLPPFCLLSLLSEGQAGA